MPHQIDGLKRALWILENKGAVLVADATGSGKTNLEHGYARLRGLENEE